MASNITDVRQSVENLKLERDAIVLYDSLASIEKDERRAAAFRTIAGNERRHAAIWADKLRSAGADVPEPSGPRLRVRVIIWLARVLGTRAVSDLVQALEGDEEDTYTGQLSPEVESIAADERQHAEIWRQLEQPAGDDGAPAGGEDRVTRGDRAGTSGDGSTSDLATTSHPAAIGISDSDRRAIRTEDPEAGIRRAREVSSPAEIAGGERWHRAGQSGTLRAVIFGVSDGLVSNLSLVTGVAGANPEPRFILLAGIAGLLAGSFSMAAGEYISMQSQRELFERQIELERAELEAMPEEEEAELAAVYRSKGFAPEEAARIAHRVFGNRRVALDTLVREELGLDPQELGNPWRAALGSLCAFAVGAAIPVAPYFFGGGVAIFAASVALSLAGSFAVGAGVSLLTGRSTLFSGIRQVGISMAAAAVTYLVGHVIGVSVSG